MANVPGRAEIFVVVGHQQGTDVKSDESKLLLVTGGTGLVGSHFAEQARARGLRVRSLCRPAADTSLLREWGVEIVSGDLNDPAALRMACDQVNVIVHCAAKVGDWGATDDYRKVNVEGTQMLLDAALAVGRLRRWVQISSLGVYPGTDHYGTTETTPPSVAGIDGYTLTKVESERLVCDYISRHKLPAIVLRPGFIYGQRDRTILPRLLARLRSGQFAYLGNPDKLMNNTFVGNLCEAIWLALQNDQAVGEVFNIRDPRAVTKQEFIETICAAAGCDVPTRIVPLHVARFLGWHMETIWKLLRRKQAPLINSARIKFLGRNLDFCIEKAGLQLGYQPQTDFREAMPATVESFLPLK